jgi:hypothetical protein
MSPGPALAGRVAVIDEPPTDGNPLTTTLVAELAVACVNHTWLFVALNPEPWIVTVPSAGTRLEMIGFEADATW